MNRMGALILIVLIIVGSIVAFIYYKNNYFPKYDWSVEYKKSNEQPYGLKLFYDIIKNRKQKTTLIYNQAYEELDTNQSNSTMIFVGTGFEVDSIGAMRILKYVEKGNRVLISSNYSPLSLIRYFVPVSDSIYDYKEQHDSIVNIDFTKARVPYPVKLKFHFQQFKDTAMRSWYVYRKQYFADTLSYYNYVPFSYLNDSNVNSFYILHGKGKIIVHANPILFTNFYLIRTNGYEHLNNMLSQLHPGPVYWDDQYSSQTKNSETPHNNPLKFLFSHPYLQWAWYVFLITILLYLVFRSKREQRIIPLMPLNTNASIEYTKAIGTLYFQNKGHNHIASEMQQIFLSEVRARYFISTDMPEAQLIDQLSLRSGIAKNILYNLFKQFKHVSSSAEASSDELINLYNAIENYHKKRK